MSVRPKVIPVSRRWRLRRWRRALKGAIRSELNIPLSTVPLGTRLRLWRHGFVAESALYYDFERHQRALFVPPFANQAFGQIADQANNALGWRKLVLYTLMSRWPGSAPAVLGVIDAGRFIPADHGAMTKTEESVPELCLRHGRVFLKQETGYGGAGAFILAAEDAGFVINGRPISADRLRDLLASLDRYLVQEVVRQADYANRIFPHVLNTLRFTTLRDLDSGEHRIVSAIHRFGGSAELAADNWAKSGINANIDLVTGQLGPGATSHLEGHVRWLDRHPVTGARVAGVEVPNWAAVCGRILEWSRWIQVSGLWGWDTAIDQAGELRVIEANTPPALRSIQVHGPLLNDPALRRYYRYLGVIQ